MSLLRKLLTPQRLLTKFLRDMGVCIAAAGLGFLINNWVGFVDASNDLLGEVTGGREAPAIVYAMGFAMALAASRKIRELGAPKTGE